MYPNECKYTESHEWIRKDGDGYVCGITDFAADQLGDVTFVDLPKVGESFAQGATLAAVESVKAASDIYAPAGGTVAAVNGELDAAPELVNQDAYGAGWFFRLSGVDEAELGKLLDAAGYEAFVKSQEGA